MSDSTMPAALEAASIVKTFGEQRALDAVDLTLRRREIHGLLGENGSGKSTLIKILCGYYQPDAGQLKLSGEPVALPLSAGDPARLGLEFVHQDLGLLPTLTVAENFALPLMARTGPGRRVSDKTINQLTTSVLDRYGVALDPKAQVWSLPAVDKALLAIVRAVHALSGDDEAAPKPLTRVLVLDEPTVFLPRRDVVRVFGLLRALTEDGCAIMLVSHDLDEVREVTDRITVLRDGKLAGQAATVDCSREDLVGMIVGRQVDFSVADRAPTTDRAIPAVKVRDLSGEIARRVSFDIRPGEILGLTGLAGSGSDEIPYLLFGARRAESGVLTLGGRDWLLAAMKPHKALGAGMAFLPSDRRRTAGIGSLDVDDNVTLPRLRHYRRWFGLNRRQMRRDTASLMDRFDVRPRETDHLFGTLSGGNQQKSLLSKWLATEPTIVLVDEPTQGVDVGARQQIFTLLRAVAAQGRSVVCASTDHEQLAMLTDRTLVFAKGRIVDELSGAELTKHGLSEACFKAADSVHSAADQVPTQSAPARTE